MGTHDFVSNPEDGAIIFISCHIECSWLVACNSLQARTDTHSHTNFKSLTKEELAIRGSYST